MLPKYPEARRFLELKLFHDLTSFRELEGRINALAEESDRIAAFSLFAEGCIATRSLPQSVETLPAPALTPEVCRNRSLPQELPGAAGFFKTAMGDTHPYAVHYCDSRRELDGDATAAFIRLMQQADEPLLFSNAASLPKKLWKAAGFQRILAPDLDRMTAGDFATFNRWLKGAGIAATRPTPSPTEAEWLSRIRSITGNRALLVTPMGADVTKTVRHLLESLGEKRTGLLLAPSLHHLRDMIRQWRRQTSWSTMAPLVLAPGKSSLKSGDLDFLLADFDSKLKHFFTQRTAMTGAVKVIIATYDILPRLNRAIMGHPPMDLALVMEAHKLAALKSDEVLNALNRSDLPVKKLFFITSTPKRMNRLKADKEGEVKPIFDLAADSRYGPLIHLGGMAEAIKKKSVRPWTFLIPVLEKADDHAAALGLCIENRPEISHIHTRHSNAAEARAFTEGIRDQAPEVLAPFTLFDGDGHKSAVEADQARQDFSHSPRAILSLGAATPAGFSEPDADLIYFAKGGKQEESHTFSPLFQNRAKDSHGLIATPLFKGKDDQWLKNPANDDLWSNLQLFMEQDTRFAEEIRIIRINFGRTGEWDVAALAEWIEVLGVGEEEARALIIRCVVGLSALWDQRFGQLLAFRDRQGHSNVPVRLADDPDLAQWAEKQRKLYFRESLATARIKELNEVGFVWDPKKAAWEGMFKLLGAYKARHNHCKVPKGWKENPELADWVIRQRREHGGGRLTPEQSGRLEAMGFVWDLELDAWENGFAALKKYHAIHGHAEIPAPYPRNRELGDWAEEQRRKNSKGTLSPERKQRLDALGFVWDREAAAWEQRFRLFTRFKKLYSHGRIADKDRDMPKLAEWAATQRRDKNRGRLDPERLRQLDQAGFVWDLEEANWQLAFAQLKSFARQNGHCTLKEKGWDKGSEEEALSRWSQEQRRLRQKNRLHPARINRLNALGFCWDLKVAAWEEMFSAFCRFKIRHGHGKLPDNFKADPPLGQWAKSQRREQATGKLDRERQARLTDAGFVWDLEAAAWEEGFVSLCKFYKQEGHFSIPPTLHSDPELPKWVKKQRSLAAKNALKKERRKRLEAIGFIWDLREAAWEEMFVALTNFTRRRNHCIVPKKWAENPRLAQWVESLRRDHKKGRIPQEKIDRLSKLGFLWDAKAVFWEEMFAALTAYRDRHGDCLVPENYPDNSELGWWVATQRKARPSGQLDEKRISRLDALEFIWNIDHARWLEMYRDLFNFHLKEGHCLVSKSDPATMLLASWCEEQRKARANNRLTRDQIDRLSELNFIWEQKLVVVEEMLMVLDTFKAEHGHCEVPTQGSKYSKLGLWLQFQRQSFKKGELDPMRQKRLQEVGFALAG